MSFSDTRILTKKSSKHPKESNMGEFHEELMLNDDEKINTKKDIFAMPNIFLSETKERSNPSKIPEKLTNAQNEKLRKSVASREIFKRLTENRLKKIPRIKLPPTDLSLIQENENEQNASSSQSDSVLNESSIEYVFSEDFSEDFSEEYSEESFNDNAKNVKINDGFLIAEESESEEDALNKTVVMSKKKDSKSSPKKLTESEITRLANLSKKVPLDTLHAFHHQGKLSENEFLFILQMKKEEEKVQKEERFFKNLESVQKIANIIDQNYSLIEKNLIKDIEKDRLKIKDFTEHIIDINKRKEKRSKLPNPEESELELKTLEVLAELNSKEKFLSLLKSGRKNFQSEYNKNIYKIQDKKRTEENVSENLVFFEIKELLKRHQESYQYLEASFVKNRKSGKSLLSCAAREHYLKLLSEKFSKELVDVEKFKDELMMVEVEKISKEKQEFEITEEFARGIFKAIEQKALKKLHGIKEEITLNLSWFRMIHNDGELKEGRQFKESTRILANNMPSNLTIREEKEKYLIENFKFFRRKVFKKLEFQFETIKELHSFFQTKKSVEEEKIQYKKKLRFETKIDELEKNVNFLEENFENKNLKSILFSQKSSNGYAKNRKFYDYLEIMKKKIENMTRFEAKIESLITFETKLKTIVRRKSLIPAKKVVKIDLRTEKVEISEETKEYKACHLPKTLEFKEKLESKYKISSKLDEFKEKNDEGLESFCKKFAKTDLKTHLYHNLTNDGEKNEYEELENRKHMDKVYELILKGEVTKSEIIEQNNMDYEPYIQPSEWEIKQGYLSKVKFSHEKNFYQNEESELEEMVRSISKPTVPLTPIYTPEPLNLSSSLNKNFSPHDIDLACQHFAREFYANPNLFNELNLSQEQFHFLMSPDYRRHFLEKKLQDQQLEERILTLIRNNPYPIRQEMYQNPEENPINYMIQTDPYFQQKIQEYQQTFVKNQELIDHYRPKLVYEAENYDLSRRESMNSFFDPFESREHEIQAKRSFNYWSSTKSDYDTVASENDQFEEWLNNRF